MTVAQNKLLPFNALPKRTTQKPTQKAGSTGRERMREKGRRERETASVFDKFLEVVAHINFCIFIPCTASEECCIGYVQGRAKPNQSRCSLSAVNIEQQQLKDPFLINDS